MSDDKKLGATLLRAYMSFEDFTALYSEVQRLGMGEIGEDATGCGFKPLLIQVSKDTSLEIYPKEGA